MTDGRKMMKLNQFNHTDIMKDVVPRLRSCSAILLSFSAFELVPVLFPTCLDPFLLQALVHHQPQSTLIQFTNLAEIYLLFLLD